MKIEIRTKKASLEYANLFKSLIEKIDPEIKKLIDEFDFTFAICNNYLDTRTKEEIKECDKKCKIYAKTIIRGNLRDTKDGSIIISIFHDTVEARYIETILYHEIGHFLDFYFCLEESFRSKKKPNTEKALSKSPEFIEAYKKDLKENWNLIKNDNNYRLKHFIQDMTPRKKPTDSALCETFAELYRHNRGLKNDTETVELYFPRAKIVQREIFKKLGWHFAIPSFVIC